MSMGYAVIRDRIMPVGASAAVQRRRSSPDLARVEAFL